MVFNRKYRGWGDPVEEEEVLGLPNWTNETQKYIDNVTQQLTDLDKSTNIMNARGGKYMGQKGVTLPRT